ncbi:MAG: thioesterase domain-containing protein, partial [Methylocella sp.]
FQFPTIAALAEWLQSQHSISISPLVKVRDGHRERPPLYLFHTGVGHVRGYQPLIAALDPADPIYGIQMRAIGNPAIDAEDFDAVIRDYVDLIRMHHPGGSYRLLGWSHGGLIAIGMAARLSELGADVSFVGLIDADLPQELDVADWQGRLTEFLKDPEAQASLAALPDRESSELEQILSHAKPAARPAAAALWGREKGLWFNHVSPEALRLETSLWRHVAAIEDTFQPPRFAGSLHVWWAKASLLKGDVPAVDWAKISGARTHEMIVDAVHHSIIANSDLHASIRQVLEWLDA